jgi:hypothetical protein
MSLPSKNAIEVALIALVVAGGLVWALAAGVRWLLS